MSRYHVQVRPDEFQHVNAESVLVESGCLLFQDEDDETILALAPGHWITVHEDEAGKTALKVVRG